jgi:hypothetical protein
MDAASEWQIDSERESSFITNYVEVEAHAVFRAQFSIGYFGSFFG